MDRNHSLDKQENSSRKSRKKVPVGFIIILLVLIIYSCVAVFSNYYQTSSHSNSSDSTSYSSSSKSSYASSSSDSSSSGYAQDDVKDWMKDQAVGKDYSYDDGGEYYCMGKNDTCPNKTKNAYDLYCNSCDPDGDNIEG